MTPRQARRERRGAERKAKKLELKKNRLADAHPLALPQTAPTVQQPCHPELAEQSPSSKLGFVSHDAGSGATTRRANSKRSTGPRSLQGKLASSRNSFKHGLASCQVIVPGEDPAAFDAFLHDLLEEHQPATATEELLIKEMAQSHWIAQRAIRLQNTCFTADGVDQKQLALFLRYQTTHQRAFYKALNDLLKLKKIGFVSQRRPPSVAEPRFVSQPDLETSASVQFVPQNAPRTQLEPPPQALKQAA